MLFHLRKSIAILLVAAMAIGIMLVGVFAITPGAADDYIPFTNEPEPDETRDNINTNSPSVVIDRFELGGYFIATQLLASVHDGATYDEVAQAVAIIEGEILSVSSSGWRYIISVPENTEAGLRNLGEILINTYPHIFERVSLSGVTVLDKAGATPKLTNPVSDTGGGGDGPSDRSSGGKHSSPAVVIDRFELGGYFIATQLLAFVHDGVTYDEVAQAVSTIDGEIINVSLLGIHYTISVPENTEARLRNLGDTLVNTYPHLFRSVGLVGVTVLDEAVATPKLTNPVSDTGSGDTGPSIVVLTEFPTGEVNVPWIDIEYIAVPTPGASIIEVFYTINDGASSTVFYHRASPDAPRGQLGTARVFAMPYAENRFVFTMLDSAGGEASFEVANRPGFAAMGGALFAPPVPPEARHYLYPLSPECREWIYRLPVGDFVRVMKIENPTWIATDRIEVIVNEGVTRAQMWEFAESIGGTIIGHIRPTSTIYTIGFPIRTGEEVLELVRRLNDGYSPLIYIAWYRRFCEVDRRAFLGINRNYSPSFNEPLADIIMPATGGQVLSPFQSRAFSLSYNKYIY